MVELAANQQCSKHLSCQVPGEHQEPGEHQVPPPEPPTREQLL